MALLAATFNDRTLSIPSLTGKPSAVSRTIRMTGAIEEGDATRLRQMLTDIRKQAPKAPGRPLATLEMSSNGGDLLEGLKIGYLLREFDVAALVRTGDACLSSCALAFLGGTASHLPTETSVARTLEVGSTLGFHNFYLNPNSTAASDAVDPREGIAKGFNQAKGGAALLVHYAASLGVDPAFIARMLGRPPEVWEYVGSAGEFIDLKICPTGPSRPPQSAQTRAINICNNTVGEASSAAAPQARRMLQDEAKRHLLGHVQKNVAAYNVKGPLATQLAAVLASRDDRLIDSVYADLQSAGLPLPEIVGQTFEISGFDAGDYPLHCIASVSQDDPDRFDVVLEGPIGLAKPNNRPPLACGGLFAFDRNDVLNPERR